MTNDKNLNATITTMGGNHYFASRSASQVLLLHPVLKYLVELKEKGELEEWLNNLQPGEIKIEDGIYASKKDILYYRQYLQFLEGKKYFDRVKQYDMMPDRYSAEDIKRTLANCRQIVYETTDFCNLKCKYCSYGELYTGFDKRENRNLNFNIARKVLDYMLELFESPLNRKHHKKIALSFYGGEPLINMSFIKETVHYAKLQKLMQKSFYFSMTTNGVLLDKHMDFLAVNNFSLLISLDGDEKNNGYRVFPDGSSSFEIVYNNCLKLKQKYPDYFKRSVNFISVIHDKNSNKRVRNFFKEKFRKSPLLIEVNPLGIKPQKKAEYEKIFNWRYSGLTPQDIIADTKDKSRILKTPFVKKLWSFLKRYSGFVFGNYDTLIHKTLNPCYVSTGTCNPFEKKIFITANGRILPCERILQAYSLGTVDEKGVHLNFQDIAEKYNRNYRKIMNQCNKCSNSDGCSLCIFNLNLEDEKPICGNFMNDEKLKNNLFQQLSILEETPQYYPRILRDYQAN